MDDIESRDRGTPTVVCGLLLLTLLGSFTKVSAQEAEAAAPPDISAWVCKFCAFESGFEGTLEGGIGYVSDDSFRFGDATGLEDAGLVFIGNAGARFRSDEALNWTLSARDLRLDSRALRLEAGRPGRFEFDLGYRELPKLRSDTAQSPFRGVGSEVLNLPAGWTTGSSTAAMPDLNASLQGADLRFERQRLDLGAAFNPSTRSDYRIHYRRDRRSGTEAMGGAFLTKAVLLPKPVDDVTEQLELSSAYALPGWQLRTAYHASFYRNSDAALTWQNPYDPLSPGADQGRLALAPDNQSHQLSTALAVQALPRTSLTAQLVFGRLLQDESLVPATVNPNLAAALPRNNSGGRVDTLNGTVRAGTRLTSSLRLNLEYRYRDRDNVTPRAQYPQVQTDVFAANSRVNRPYRFTDQTFKLSVGHRLPVGGRIAAGYDHETHRRSLQSVDRTEENTAWLRSNFQLQALSDLEFRVARGRRDGPAPHPIDATAPPENPRQRHFNLADRDRTVATLHWSGVLEDRVSFGAGADYALDQYSSTEVGLTEGRDFNVSADLAFTPTPERAITASLGHGQIRSTQAGSQTFSAADWRADSRDNSDTLSLNLEQRNFFAALDLSVSYSFMQSRGETMLDNGGQISSFPDLKTRLQGLGISGRYRLREDVSLQLGLRREQYSADDWQQDGVEAATVPNLLAMDLAAADYRVNLVYLSLLWQLGIGRQESSE